MELTLKGFGAVHGGDLDFAARKYGLKRESIIDFSGNINPFGVSKKAMRAICDNAGAITTYPDVNYLSLRTAIAEYLEIDDAHLDKLVVGNGGTELISLFIRLLGKKNAVILSPVYSEYEREVRLGGGECTYYELSEEKAFNADIDELTGCIADDTGLLVICNPNNPTGTAIEKDDMEIVIRRCADRGVNVLIDETYCEFAEEEQFSSVSLALAYDNVIVIRGVSKFFASPGIRLGYAVCGGDIAAEMGKIKNPWSVNSLAVFAAEAFFSDFAYVAETKGFIASERARIKRELAAWEGVRAYDTVTNFQLVKILGNNVSSAQIFEALIKKGIMIRDASSFKTLDNSYLRFCFLESGQNDMLLRELKKFFV